MWQPSASLLDLASQFRSLYREAVTRESANLHLLKEFTSRFSNTLLLPLQISRASSFAAISPIQDQLMLALGVRSKLPESCGLIVTEHPRPLPGLTPDGRQYLAGLDNVLLFGGGSPAIDASDAAAPFVQAIATVSSTVAALSLLWSKRLISISGRYAVAFADQLGSPRWPVPGRDSDEDLRILAFLIKHWAIPSEQLSDPCWMRARMLLARDRATGRADPAAAPSPAWDVTDAELEAVWLRDFRPRVGDL
jgi:hypothetical protein